jgi:hypothetical protein
MKKILLTGAFLALFLGANALAQQGQRASVQSMAPSVVRTVPQCGHTAVDPDLKEIKVTFSKDMNTNRMWAVVQTSKETFPETPGQIHYADNRTCVVPVKLEPNKTYVLWFNRGQFNSFRDKQNNPAVPYQLVFETRSNNK